MKSHYRDDDFALNSQKKETVNAVLLYTVNYYGPILYIMIKILLPVEFRPMLTNFRVC